MSAIKNRDKKSISSPPLLADPLAGALAVSPVRLKTLKHRAQALIMELETLLAEHTFPANGPVDFYEEVRRFEINLILWALEQTGGEQKNAARLLHLKKTTLNAMITRYGLKKNEETGLKELMYEMIYNSKGIQ